MFSRGIEKAWNGLKNWPLIENRYQNGTGHQVDGIVIRYSCNLLPPPFPPYTKGENISKISWKVVGDICLERGDVRKEGIAMQKKIYYYNFNHGVLSVLWS